MREAPAPSPAGPTTVAFACVVLALTTAGLGLLVAFREVAPWNGIALCLIVTSLLVGLVGGAHLRRHRDPAQPTR
ncbi:hypothetical protein [Arthrobacter sp. B1805]|uniref:hypothetical protein n=1 Tax=Arthrobacter sp. B1805 TaxID=2058892 RepID=UPI000CE2E049|nr:hypothetical protein [Arthrobacter sp. B1805]